MNEYESILHELALNWKLRLVVSALFSMLGLAFLIATLSGIFTDLNLLDQTIVGVAVFIVMIPIYLIIADLPKIDEVTIAEMLNELVPDFNHQAHLVLKDADKLNDVEQNQLPKVEALYQNKSLYKYLPNRPIKQAAALMLLCLSLSVVGYYFI